MGVRPDDRRLAVVRSAAPTPSAPAPAALARIDSIRGWLTPMQTPRRAAIMASGKKECWKGVMATKNTEPMPLQIKSQTGGQKRASGPTVKALNAATKEDTVTSRPMSVAER